MEPESPTTTPRLTGSVWTTLPVPGFHNWPEAPSEVSHLRARHRHVFWIRVSLGVNHAERAIEFQLLQSNLDGFFQDTQEASALAYEFGNASCETIAQKVMGFLIDFYPSSYPYEVTVSEDNESGATLRSELV